MFINFVIIMDFLDSDILKMKFDQPTPKVGDILLAEPLMNDIAFQRSVVILIEHSDDAGSLGFVTNRCSNYNLHDLVEEIEREDEIPIYIGGPVHRDRLYYIHTLGNLIPESIEVCNGLYVSGDFKTLIEYVNSGAPIEGKVRFFLGCSGWEKEQLEKELKNFDWAVKKMRNPQRLLSLDEEDAWRAEVSELDEQYLLWRNCPSSTILN
jgi:putative transcriptional regulator